MHADKKALFLRFMRDLRKDRGTERILWPPVKCFAVNRGFATALNHMKGRRARLQNRRHHLPCRDHHCREPHRRKHICAGFGVHEIQLGDTVICVFIQLAQRGLGPGPGIADHRIFARTRPAFARGYQARGQIFHLPRIGPVALGLQGAFDRIRAFEIIKQRQVQRIQPHHGFIAIVAVVMPVTAGGQDQIAFRHRQAFAVDDGKAAFAFDDNPHRRGCVDMGRCRFTRQQQLHPQIDRGRGLHRPCPTTGVRQHQHATFGLCHRSQLASAQQQWAQVTIIPKPSACGRVGAAMRQHVPHHRPQRRDACLSHRIAIVLRQLL